MKESRNKKKSRDLKQQNNEVPFPFNSRHWTVEEPDTNKHLKRFLPTF